jgi:hypothetical protein
VKVAFVSQPIDTILPPYRSSVGACSYGAACSLSKSCEVAVYGTTNRHKDFPADLRKQNVHFRFFSVPLSDRLAAKAREKYSELPENHTASVASGYFRLSDARWRRIYVCRFAM